MEFKRDELAQRRLEAQNNLYKLQLKEKQMEMDHKLKEAELKEKSVMTGALLEFLQKK